MAAIAADPGNEVRIVPRTSRSSTCSANDQAPSVEVTGYDAPHLSLEERQRRVRDAHADGAQLIHRGGGYFPFRGTGGGSDATLRITPSLFCDNLNLQITLTHELVHCLRNITGKSVGERMQAWDNLEEFYACMVENVMRSEKGQGLRASHNSLGIERVMLDAFEDSRSGSRPSSRPGTLAMRVPRDPVSLHDVEDFLESRRNDGNYIRGLSDTVYRQYRGRFENFQSANRNLATRLKTLTHIAFNPFVRLP